MIQHKPPSTRSELEGEPFSILIEGKNRHFVTLLILVNYLVWLGGSIFLIGLDLVEQLIMIVLTVFGLVITGKKVFFLSGSKDNWVITRYLSYYLFVIPYRSNIIFNPHFELRVVSQRRKGFALLTLFDDKSELTLTIKINNLHAKDLVEFFQNIDLSLIIRKRGKQQISL